MRWAVVAAVIALVIAATIVVVVYIDASQQGVIYDELRNELGP